MAELTTTTGNGTQAATQSPQASVGSAPGAGQSSTLQPGQTGSSLQTSGQGGIALHSSLLPAVTLGASDTTQTQTVATPVVKHHTNPILFGFSGLLFVVAATLFIVTERSAKNTTDY